MFTTAVSICHSRVSLSIGLSDYVYTFPTAEICHSWVCLYVGCLTWTVYNLQLQSVIVESVFLLAYVYVFNSDNFQVGLLICQSVCPWSVHVHCVPTVFSTISVCLSTLHDICSWDLSA